ncbi:MAG: hypothetical protein ACRC42_01465 [Mycoplasma sp.]
MNKSKEVIDITNSKRKSLILRLSTSVVVVFIIVILSIIIPSFTI